MTTEKSEQELVMLNNAMKTNSLCSGVVITRVRSTGESWEFEIPSGTTAPCRSAIIREQAALKMRYHLAQVD